MSECNRYEYRQPVEIRYGSKWFKGVVTAFDGCDSECPVCVRWLNQNGTSCSDWPTLDEIRPDPDYRLAPVAEPARTGWRLPEKGDVVKHDGKETEVEWLAFSGTDGLLISLKRISPLVPMSEVTLVRLHDAPEPPQPVTPAPEPRPAKQGIIDNATLELAAVALEQHGQDRIAAMVRDLQRDWSEAS